MAAAVMCAPEGQASIELAPPMRGAMSARAAPTSGNAVPATAAPSGAAPRPLAAVRSPALDWSKPWLQPHDSRRAATNSDEYAWRLFVALNWPADTTARSADRTVSLGADRAVVWETWQNAADVYLDDGRDPGPWGAGSPTTLTATEHRFETLSLKDIPNARHIVGGKMVPLTDPAASAQRLTEIRMNRLAFDYIRARELYNLDGQLRTVTTGQVTFPAGATEVKAKWRPIRGDEQARYHTLKVRFADGTERLYGLTALHIVAKDLPQWLWATFEHVDNPTLPDADGWQLPSNDHFACAGEPSTACNQAPRGIGLEQTVWQNYRLRGTLTRFVDASSRPLLLANSELEAGMQHSSSCITCHARSSLAVVDGTPLRLPVFDMSSTGAAPAALNERRGYVGQPSARWFENPGTVGRPLFQQLDFVWSLSKARPRKVPHET